MQKIIFHLTAVGFFLIYLIFTFNVKLKDNKSFHCCLSGEPIFHIKLLPSVLPCGSLGSWTPRRASFWQEGLVPAPPATPVATPGHGCQHSSSSTPWRGVHVVTEDRMDPPPLFQQLLLEFVIFNHVRWQLDGADAPGSRQGLLA